MDHRPSIVPPPLPLPLRDRLRALVAREGKRLTLARLGVSRQSLARALAGLPLYPGTRALIRQALDAAEAEARRTAEAEARGAR